MYRLLIVDDNPVQIQSVIEFIDWAKYGITDISTAQNGSDGLKSFIAHKPDIVITDVLMPIMDGIEFQKKAKEIYPQSKFIFMSCYEDFNFLKKAMDNDVVTYILKPLEPEDLEAAAKNAINQLEQEQRFSLMSNIFDESIDIFRENFLCRFLYSTHVDKEYLERTLHNLGFDKYHSFIIAMFEISGGDTEMYNIIDHARNTLFKSFTAYAIVDSTDRFIFAFMSEESDGDFFGKKLYTELSKFIREVSSAGNITITGGQSLSSNTLYSLPSLLRQAGTALEYFLSLSIQGLCIYENRLYIQPNYEISDMIESLNALLDDSTSEKINSFLDEYYPPNLHQNYVKPLCTSIITTLQLILLERNLDIKNLFGNSSVIYAKLDNFDAQYNARQWLYNLLNAAVDLISDNERNKYDKIIISIKRIIDENYRTISNIDQISEQIHISTSYAKNIFKKYTNTTIFEYLLAKRMNVAKQLLSDPCIKIYEVADLVGYKSKAHFSETFRRYTGITPKDFQKNPVVR